MSTRKVVIAGSSGLIGTALTAALRADGTEVVRLVRRAPRTLDEVQWSPGAEQLAPDVLADAHAVVNLCGASIAKLPWTSAYQRELRDSRLVPTHTLAAAINQLSTDRPRLLSASAVGFYGSQPGKQLSEHSGAGTGFLAELCVDWEHEARAADTEVTLLRTASLLHRRAVLKPLIALTKFGLGGPLGSGTQYWPWISLEDEVRAIRHLIDAPVTGPVNLCGPVPARANEIGRELAQQLHRPFVLPAPAWALRAVLRHDAADALLLADANVAPVVLQDSGFTFAHEDAAGAISSALTER